MTKEHRIILQLVKQFKDLDKMEIYDILEKMEKLLNSVYDLDIKKSKSILHSWEHPNAIEGNNGTYYHLIDSAQKLRIYKLYDPNACINIGRPYYYKTPFDNEPQKLTEKKLLASVKNTVLELPIQEYLFNNKLLKRNPKTNCLSILDFLEKKKITRSFKD